jgi:hypothetical protein
MNQPSVVPVEGSWVKVLPYDGSIQSKVVSVSKDGKTVKIHNMMGMFHQNWALERLTSNSTLVWRKGSWCVKRSWLNWTDEFNKSQEESGLDTFSYLKTIGKLAEVFPHGYNLHGYGDPVLVKGITKVKHTYNKVLVEFENYVTIQ